MSREAKNLALSYRLLVGLGILVVNTVGLVIDTRIKCGEYYNL